MAVPREGSRAVSREVYSDQELEELTEEIVFLIRQSCAIQLARVDAFLEGAELAAEQVQDIRIQKLETPPPVSGWEYFGEVLLTLFLDSTVGGKVLASLAKRIFTPVLKQWFIFMALPDAFLGPDGKDLKKRAQEVARLMSQPTRFSYGTLPGIPARLTLKTVITRQLGKKLGSEDVKIYGDSLEAVFRGTPDAQKNLVALGKAIRTAKDKPKPTAPAMFSASDSTGVTILSAVQNYASLVRLGIQISHARFEKLVRGKNVMPAELGYVIDAFGWEDLKLDDAGGQGISVDLVDIRSRYKMVIEALIWARLYGFDKARRVPDIVNRTYWHVPDTLRDYWFARFADAVDAWNKDQGWYAYRGYFQNLSGEEKALKLRDYFWHLNENLTNVVKPREEELTQRAVP